MALSKLIWKNELAFQAINRPPFEATRKQTMSKSYVQWVAICYKSHAALQKSNDENGRDNWLPTPTDDI